MQSHFLPQEYQRGQPLCIGPYDMQALRLALEAKKTMGARVVCLCMGVPQSVELLRRFIAMGADDAVVLSDAAFAGSDTFATSYILAAGIKKMPEYDLILCGEKSPDGETGQVPAALAQWLCLPCLVGITALCGHSGHSIGLSRQTKTEHQELQMPTPFVGVACGYTLDEPPLGLLQIKRARNSIINVWDIHALGCKREHCGLLGSKTKVVEVKDALRHKKAQIITENAAKALCQMLVETQNDG